MSADPASASSAGSRRRFLAPLALAQVICSFAGGIIGAFLVALLGALVSGYALPAPGLPTGNPPGLGEAFWALPGSIIALAASYVWGCREPE